jgi:hypothetical protein
MESFLENIIPQSKAGGTVMVGAAMSILLAVFIGLAFVMPRDSVAIYGFAVFFGVPFFVGVFTALVVGYHNDVSFGRSVACSLAALTMVGSSLLLVALEGLICLVMAFPIAVCSMLIGTAVGHNFRRINSDAGTNIYRSFLVFLFFMPSLSAVESNLPPSTELIPVTTVIEINAPPEKVWKNVVEFPELAPPTEVLFKTGIAYPIRARIEGAGVGAIRYCEFSTGAFVEPIEVWDENKLLRFSVREQPIPMRELSPYGELDTPHLHDYFVSSKGEFKLTRLENGGTRLEGTTWYYHKISPEFYWRIWTEQIVHSIHQRVLSHIKEQSEKN